MLSFPEIPKNLEASHQNEAVRDSSLHLMKFWLAILSVIGVWLGILLWIHAHNPRLLPSWHGFLHTAIAMRFTDGSFPPENPFFAGEKLPYYWAYQYFGFIVARILKTDLLHAFRFIALSSLAVLVIFSGLTGYKYFRSIGAGLLIGYLAVAGANPFGPLIALAKHWIKAAPLISPVSSQTPVETLFVTNRMADDWMTQPLLPALYISSEWWHGQNIVWFIDISARAPALSLVFVLLFLLLSPRLKFGKILLITLLAALITAFNPITGFVVSGSLLGASLIILCLTALKRSHFGYKFKKQPLVLSLLCLTGTLLAAPTYYHLFLLNKGTLSLTSSYSVFYLFLKLAALSANFLILVSLAILGSWKSSYREGIGLWTLTLAGILLLLVVPLIILWPHNEHNLTNAAACLLAVPAVAWITCLPKRKEERISKGSLFLLLLGVLFLPTTFCTLLSYTGRPPLPLGFRGQTLQRLPEEGPLENLYAWIRNQTPSDAVFLCDPNEPVKMSGNVAELPAFTARTLFIDLPGYLTSQYKDANFRTTLAGNAAKGYPLTPPQRNYLRHLQRPLYLITYHADQEDLLNRLIQQNGGPIFRQDFVAVFKITLDPIEFQPSKAGFQPLQFDLAFSTYLGGSQFEHIRGITTDSSGNIYVTGGTTSPDFPVTNGVYQTTLNPAKPDSPDISPMDVFVTKLDPGGKIIWSTFLGGPNYDRAYAIAVDNQDYVYVAGRAGKGFPVTRGAFQTSFQGGQEAPFYGPQDGFICKLTPDGSKLVFCSYFGTPDPSIIRDIAVDPKGDIYLASGYSSGRYPKEVHKVFNNKPHGDHDAVIAKIHSDGSRVLWATYLGGSDWESNENSVRLDGAGNPYVLLTTRSTDMPVTENAYGKTYAGHGDLYVAKLTPDEGKLVWGTYLGGPENESTETHEFAVDAEGNAYIAAPTKSPDFPTTPGAFQRKYEGGPNEIFVAKISPDGSQLLASTLLGGKDRDRPEGVAVDTAGNVYFTGTTTSNNFPVTRDAFQPNLIGDRNAFAVVLSADFSRLLYATYLGGGGGELGRAATVDSHGNFYIAGQTDSKNWPVHNAFQPAYSGNIDGFIAGFKPNTQKN
ncbi:MAG TPA: SBBP repeat-containing protein [Candidatus Limnocylindrales bacterium]|nr:SBBP repeat-containing protein [Candidatus Limnocylindrales bacterium]